MITESAIQMAGTARASGTGVEDDAFSENFRSYFEMLVAIEGQLLDSYDRALEILDEAAP